MKFPRDRRPVQRDKRSQPMQDRLPDGNYVYVQDTQGVIWALPDGPHRHPRVLGGGSPAQYAGDLVVENGRIHDVTNLSGTFRFDDPDGLLAVADQLERIGYHLNVGGAVLSTGRRPAQSVAMMSDSAELPTRILILEDDAERRRVMGECLLDRFPQYEVRFFVDAPSMVAWLQADAGPELVLISLDHDLEPSPEHKGVDPGTGRDVADCLAGLRPGCPIVVHTTNTTAGDGMQSVLDEAGWTTIRIVPYDAERWIGETWFRAARNAIVGSVQRRAEIPA